MTFSTIAGPTIPAGQSISNAVNLSDNAMTRIVMPDAWDTNAALTFQFSLDDTDANFRDVYFTDGKEIALKVVPKAAVLIPQQWSLQFGYLKFRSGACSKPIIQSANRTFLLAAASSMGPPGPAGAEGPPGPPGPTGPTGISADAGNLAKLGSDNLILVPNTSILKGIVDGSDAPAGFVGEVVSASNTTGTSFTSQIPVNLATLHLLPGDWNVGSVVTFTPTNTGPNGLAAGITLTSGTLPTDAEVATGKGILNQIWSSALPSNKIQTLPTSLIRVNTSVPKDVFLVGMASFGGGSVSATSYLSARRVR